MRIAMVSMHGDPRNDPDGRTAGGVHLHVRELARELGTRGHAVTLYARREDPETPQHLPMAPEVTVHQLQAGPPIPSTERVSLRSTGEFAAALRDALALNPPDLIHAHGWLAGAAAVEAANGGIPIVQSFHGLGIVERRHQHGIATSPPGRLDVERRIAREAHLVLASCVDEQRELLRLGVPRSSVEVVPSGVDTSRFRHGGGSSRRGRRPRVLSLGRLLPHKGVDIPIHAMRHVPDAELVVAGGPLSERLHADPEVTRLRTAASRHLVEDRVRFHGRVDHEEVPALLRDADVVVATPWHEAFGRVVVEAMASGVPVVASSVGGMLDTVQHGRTGLLVPARDPMATASALRYLIGDPVLRRRMGTSASAWANDRYAWPHVADELLERYGEVMGRSVLPAAVAT